MKRVWSKQLMLVAAALLCAGAVALRARAAAGAAPTTAPTTVPVPAVRVSCVAAAPVFGPADDVDVYFMVANRTDRPWTGYLPNADEAGEFTWSMIDVRHGGKLLEHRRPEPNSWPVVEPVTLRPGETYVVKVRLDYAFRMPPRTEGGAAGDYRINILDWSGCEPEAGDVVFAVRREADAADPPDLVAALARPDWQDRLPALGGRAGPDALAAVVKDLARSPVVRRRALLAYGRAEQPNRLGDGVVKMLHEADPILALAIAEEAPAWRLSERDVRDVLLSTLGLTKDVAVQRTAAGELLKIGALTSDEFDHVLEY